MVVRRSRQLDRTNQRHIPHTYEQTHSNTSWTSKPLTAVCGGPEVRFGVPEAPLLLCPPAAVQMPLEPPPPPLPLKSPASSPTLAPLTILAMAEDAVSSRMGCRLRGK